ncbi:hypothetical protein Q2T42_10625 [Leptolyngbya boryana CZ1]|jgi:hypothetical protein|uniref:Uncharacterized protein n=2 Tax=Leptolyngbya boryana TaxID=1184 RepID=A0A1Z4JQL3_LEPBY|nr:MULTISPECIES: hypothetical protein [Leptolyngbya]BAY58947.1 hypothetical protein NIES2135_58220 [Leptolyngbya boryana NIES-2135]ULP29997.1 hypothetical protein MCP04_28890 [Leptolyngbya boryana IU 594]WNZ48281.1 hypothetical protein Q2T42_10625 [Leptolyngbya boryana CZ1]BAS54914.1 hypothetical protein LBWT_8130 [Leptolyngbya boryana IAM M-101]BAS61262.1 hypothetical protein LBDG_08130 [Leptolyngbya boryana dg5]
MKSLPYWALMSVWAIAVSQFPVQAATRVACPTEIEPLVRAMLPELPGYANRITVRERLTRNRRSSVILAGRPEFEPLPLNSDRPPDLTLKQVFITTLGREYVGNTPVELQEFHWLFLTRSQRGWQLPLMFTRIGTTTPGQPITPPRESRESSIGKAIQLWLQDCDRRGIRKRN